MKEELLKLDGQVTEVLPNAQFRVDATHNDKKFNIRCYLNGRMRFNKIKVLLGDKVEIELPPSSHLENGIGRIIFRKK